MITVVEASPFWTPELQRQFLGEGVFVRLCDTVQRALSEPPPDLLVLPLERMSPEILILAARQKAPLPSRGFGSSGRAIVIDRSGGSEWEWLLREAGVDACVGERIGGEPLSRLCRRLLRRAA